MASPAPLRRRYGPTALVTGASDGIGRALAEQLAAAGFDLLLVSRRADVLGELAADLRARHGIGAQVCAADLATPAGVGAVIDAAAGHDIGLFVAAAGYGTAGPFLANRAADELDMLAVNCHAVTALTHALAGQMRARPLRDGKRGGLMLFGSLVGFQGVPRAANYAATKAYIQTLAEGLRPELAGDGIDVLSVAPGPIASGFAARAGMTMGLAQTPDVVATGALAALGRTGTVRPGWLSKALEFALMPLPRRGRTLIMTQVMAGMTR